MTQRPPLCGFDRVAIAELRSDRCVKGNCDGVVNFDDINCFTWAISNACPPADPASYPCHPCDCMNGDINGDEEVNFGDINPFNQLQTGGNVGASRTYVWDAENRLIEVRPTDDTEAEGDKKVEFAYDYRGRRVQKKVWTYDGQQWNLTDRRKFVWSGWLMLLELDGGTGVPPVIRKYTWGLDLAGQSGSVAAGLRTGRHAGHGGPALQGAGGTLDRTAFRQGQVSGLPAVHDAGESQDYLYLYDANGNVGQVLDWDATTLNDALVAHYEYDPYGNLTASTGDYADENPIRFSTHQFDPETGLIHAKHRYYEPQSGRWINRDPIEERGGVNLYNYVENSPLQAVDPKGQYALSTSVADNAMRKACCTCWYHPSDYDRAYCQREVRCPGRLRSPAECCRCCNGCGKPGFWTGAGTLAFAEWGSCCFCTVRVKRDSWVEIVPHHGFELTCPNSKYEAAFTLTVDRDMAEKNSLWGPAKIYCGHRPYRKSYMAFTIAEKRVSCWVGYRLKMEIESAFPLSCSGQGYDYSMDRFPFQQCRSFGFRWYEKARPPLKDCPSSW